MGVLTGLGSGRKGNGPGQGRKPKGDASDGAEVNAEPSQGWVDDVIPADCQNCLMSFGLAGIAHNTGIMMMIATGLNPPTAIRVRPLSHGTRIDLETY